jgi:Na+/H+ antiporter NhaD/arsenite permease-like protein
LTTIVFVSVVFIATYFALSFQKEKRARVVWVGVALFAAYNFAVARDPYWADALQPVRDVNWNVIGIFIGSLLVAEAFTVSMVPARLAEGLIRKAKTVGLAIVLVAALSGFLSAFVENVATVLILAPIAVAMAKRLNVSPAPFLISVAISSNLQGTATLIGDPPSMILAGHYRLSFNDFFWLDGKPSIFFAVEIGAIASLIVLYFMFRKYREPVGEPKHVEVKSWTPTWILGGMIVALAVSPLFDPEFKFLAGVICLVFGAVAKLWEWKHTYAQTSYAYTRETLRRIDWDTTLFLIGIFIFVGVLERAGVVERIADFIQGISGTSLFAGYNIILWFSVLVSAFVDNVPYISAMLPVTTVLAERMGSFSYLLPFGLLIGSCLGGNITPIGAAANIVAVGYLARMGTKVSFGEFAKIGLPFTLAATLAGGGFIWLVWG